ncbi:MAG: hypothetical protein SFY66_10765 [Oculatellaceae cyanobacterium bins.114]|nr:hypothetical protein [Oculatellaceae cyanobacterium bins.114]
MNADFKQLRREIFQSFTSVGIPIDAAAIAAIALARWRIFGIAPNQGQQHLVNLCVHFLALV